MGYYGLIIPPVFPTGVFIQDVKQTASSNENEGVNTMTVTLTNQQKACFNVKNGKQGSSVEATAQMEQHAKEYIAYELAEQKIALNQAIENGKTDINNSIVKANEALQQKVSLATLEFTKLIKDFTQDEINKTIEIIKNKIKDLRDIVDYSFKDNFGWVKFRNNLIIQFFKIKAKGVDDNEARFPISFPNKVLTITTSLIADTSIDDPRIAVTLYIWGKTKTGFKFSSAFHSEIYGDKWATCDYDVIAIGY